MTLDEKWIWTQTMGTKCDPDCIFLQLASMNGFKWPARASSQPCTFEPNFDPFLRIFNKLTFLDINKLSTALMNYYRDYINLEKQTA